MPPEGTRVKRSIEILSNGQHFSWLSDFVG